MRPNNLYLISYIITANQNQVVLKVIHNSLIYNILQFISSFNVYPNNANIYFWLTVSLSSFIYPYKILVNYYSLHLFFFCQSLINNKKCKSMLDKGKTLQKTVIKLVSLLIFKTIYLNKFSRYSSTSRYRQPVL